MFNQTTQTYTLLISVIVHVYIFGWIKVKVTWRLSSFTGGVRPQVPLRALFRTRAGT